MGPLRDLLDQAPASRDEPRARAVTDDGGRLLGLDDDAQGVRKGAVIAHAGDGGQRRCESLHVGAVQFQQAYAL